MSGAAALDEATLVWAAALVEGVDPAPLLATVDVAALAAVVAEADGGADPVEVAAGVLVAMVRRRPFPASNAAVGWLVVVDHLAAEHLRITAGPAAVAELCDAVRLGVAGPAEVAGALRAWATGKGVGCPACGRRVYVLDAQARRSLAPAGARYELTARCAHEHGGHDRSGRPIPPPAVEPPEPGQPVLARGDCGSILVVEEAGSVVVSPFCDDPPIVRVVAVGDLRAGDLVGRWDALVERSTTLGFVPAHEAAPDEGGRVDVVRLRRALRAASRQPAMAAGASHHRGGPR